MILAWQPFRRILCLAHLEKHNPKRRHIPPPAPGRQVSFKPDDRLAVQSAAAWMFSQAISLSPLPRLQLPILAAGPQVMHSMAAARLLQLSPPPARKAQNRSVKCAA
jgi:hypothetical protein